MDNSIDVDEVRTEINRYLLPEQQIHPNDPMFTGIVLNKIALSSNVRVMEKRLDDAVKQILTAGEQQTQQAAVISDRTLAKTGDQIGARVEAAFTQLEHRLQVAGSDVEAKMRRANWLAWTGAMAMFISACILLGSYMGNAAFELMHHAKQRHK